MIFKNIKKVVRNFSAGYIIKSIFNRIILFSYLISESIGIRHVQIILLFFYNFIVFSQSVNLSVAIMAMVNNTDNTDFVVIFYILYLIY